MLNLDDLNTEELEVFIKRIEGNPKELALELWQNKPPAFMRSFNLLRKYAETRIDLLDSEHKGRNEKVEKLATLANNIYRALPDYAKWDE